MLNGPTQIALTFCDHFDTTVTGIRNEGDLSTSVKDLIDKVQEETGVPVTLVETGKFFGDIIQLNRA